MQGNGKPPVIQIPVDFNLELTPEKDAIVATARCGPLAQQQVIPLGNVDAYIAALVKLQGEARRAIVLPPTGLIVPS